MVGHRVLEGSGRYDSHVKFGSVASGTRQKFMFSNRSLFLTRMSILDGGFAFFSLSMVSHETRGTSSSTEHLVSIYCEPNTKCWEQGDGEQCFSYGAPSLGETNT